MINKKTFLFFLSESTSHFLQPLDSYPFAGLKRGINLIYEGLELDVALTGESPFKSLLKATYVAEKMQCLKERSKRASRAVEFGRLTQKL